MSPSARPQRGIKRKRGRGDRPSLDEIRAQYSPLIISPLNSDSEDDPRFFKPSPDSLEGKVASILSETGQQPDTKALAEWQDGRALRLPTSSPPSLRSGFVMIQSWLWFAGVHFHQIGNTELAQDFLLKGAATISDIQRSNSDMTPPLSPELQEPLDTY